MDFACAALSTFLLPLVVLLPSELVVRQVGNFLTSGSSIQGALTSSLDVELKSLSVGVPEDDFSDDPLMLEELLVELNAVLRLFFFFLSMDFMDLFDLADLVLSGMRFPLSFFTISFSSLLRSGKVHGT